MKKLRLNTLSKDRRSRYGIVLAMLFIVVLSCAILLTLIGGEQKSFALAVPEDYGTGYTVDKIDDLAATESFEGILCNDNENKQFTLQYTEEVNGLVTLARISHNSSLEGYTFAVNYGGIITLKVNYEDAELATPLSAGSFFGIGNDAYPFKGTLTVGGGQDTPITVAQNGWRYLFNNLSNQGSIISNGKYLYSTNVSTSSEAEEANSFVFAKKLTVTDNVTPLNISGFRFGSSASSENNTLAHGSGPTALFAGEVLAGTGSTCTVDLSGCFIENAYTVVSDDDDAAGLIARVGEGVDLTINLPASLNVSVTSGGSGKNAGLLIGANNGSVTFTGDGTSTLSGSLSVNGSAGLIGTNAVTAAADFDVDLAVSGLKVTAVNAGGVVGVNYGIAHLSDTAIDSLTLTSYSGESTAYLGGVAGYMETAAADKGIIVLEGKAVTLSDLTHTVTQTSTAGGAVGYWKNTAATQNMQGVNVASAAISFNQTAGTFGGYVGVLETDGDFTIKLSSTSAIAATGLSEGIYGGVIGRATSSVLANTVLIEGDGVETCSVDTASTANTTEATAGGVVGRIGEATFVKVNNLALNNAIVKRSGNDTNNVYAADVVGVIEANGIIDIGNLTLSDTQGSVLVGATGVGSVVRLGGTITDNSATVNNIVFQQDSSLIYKDSGCVYSGAVSSYNDIASYGQVIRNDNLGIISMDENHVVSISSPIDASGDITLSGTVDFAKLSITFYTQGVFSGVDGITGDNYTDLLSKTVNLTGNVDLTNTGIEQLTRPDSNENAFTGTLNGGGYTVTMAIGQSLLDDTNNGDTDVHIGYNKRVYQGLFAALNGATVNNLTIDGLIKIGIYYKAYYVGSLAGYATGGLTVEGCRVSTKIELEKGNTTFTNVYPFTDIGGLVGRIVNATSLSVKNSSLGAEISDSVPYSTGNWQDRYFWGGLSGQVSYKGSSKIDLTGNTVTTKLTKTGTYSYLKTGGLIAVLSCTDYTEVDLDGTCADVSLTTSGVTGSVGGILGYTYTNCHLNNLNGTYRGTVNAGSAALGGLVYTLSGGRMTVESGFSLGESTFTTTKANAENCGMLLSDGRTSFVSVACPVGAFASVTADGFDLIAGQNISSYTSVDVAEYGGIVTIETGDGIGKVPVSSDWFTAINARQNSKTRYYFNILNLNVTNATTTELKLLLWHVNNYSNSNLIAGVRQEYLNTTTVADGFTATADANMTDYCFYPTQRSYSTTVDFNNYSLTFATPAKATAAQFYGMQAGLLSDVNADEVSTTVIIQNIKLCGTVANLGENKGSGAFICGKANGNVSSSDSTVLTCNITVDNVVLGGLKVEGTSGYRPLFINTMGSYTNATVTNISQSGYADGDNAACSLIGCGGVEESSGIYSSYLNVTLQGVALEQSLAEDGTVSSIFTHSMLFFDVKYISATSSVVYTFTFEEDWGEGTPHAVTYGAELYFDEEQQLYYDCYIFINPVTIPDGSSTLYENFKYYLPYVYNGFVFANSSTNRNLSVNRKGADFIEGWGTYENPYIINSPKQLIDLSIWLSGTASFNEGWQINFPQGDWEAVSTLDLTDYYLVTMSGGTLIYTIDEENKIELSTDVLLEYLAGAYYKMGDIDLTLNSDFVGLGSTKYPFHGVIHGNNKTLTLASPSSEIGAAGYGFINVANGCAIYDLTISYGEITLSENTLASATSAPNATTLTTSMPHFGGAIAWVVGGDNMIDSVTVTVDSVSGSCNTAFGSYVGLISGGGVLVSDLGEVSGFNSNANIYHNNYIGRVLNGYAIAIDGKTYDNGKNSGIVTDLVVGYEGDFKIPTLSLNDITAHSAGFNGTNTFTIADEEELLMLSYALNSGALHSTTGYAYGQNALSRYGDYSKVGGTVTGIADGKYKDDTFAVALPAAYFGIAAQTSLASTELIISLTSTSYDMTGYGNGFRGMSGTYSTGFIYKIKSFGNDSQKATIAVKMNMPQYGVPASSIYDPDSLTAYGLFGRSACVVAFKNLVLTGNICVTTIDYSNVANYYGKSPAYGVGGLLGYMNENISVNINNVTMNQFSLVSPGYAGGFVGYFFGGTAILTVTNTSGSDLSQNVLIKGQKHTGGCVGYVYKGNSGKNTVQITSFEISDSTIEVVQKTPKGDSQTGVGGIAGALYQNNAAIVMENCTVTKTAVVLYASYSSQDASVGSGGLVGWANSSGSITATGCTVDGCVVLSIGLFSGSSGFPYVTYVGSDDTVADLSDDINNNLIYNGTNQSSVRILAYLLEQNSSTNKYAIGTTGGLIGCSNKATTLKDCTVKAKSAPMVIAGLNNSSGLVGDLRSGVALEVKNCTVSTQGHDMYIMGAYRAAGVMSYRSASGTVSLTDCNVVGTQENPIRIVQFMHSNGEASGLLGNVNTINSLTAKKCRVSYCIIAGAKASAVHTTTQASTGTLKNIHVDNSVIYSRNSYAGGLFNEYTATYSLEGVYLADNYVIGYTGAGGLVGTATSGSLSGKYIIMDNNTVCKGKQATNYTFATSDLTDVAKAASALYNSASPDFTNVGVIAGNNAVTVQLYAVSCSLPDSINTQQKNFYTDTGSSSYVIYNAYGARATYSGFTTEYDTKTPQQTAIEARNYSAATGDGSASLYGDSVTAGTPSAIAGLDWWVGDKVTVGADTIKNLSTFVEGVTNNSDLPLFCFSDKTNDTLTAYLNMLTGGFSTLTQLDSSLVSITSYRYSVADDCNDTEDGCIYTERYLLVVFPVQGSGKTYYNMKAIIDDEQRQTINNIAVRPLVEVYGQVTIWEQPAVTNSATYVDGTAEGKSFSYQADDVIEMTVENTITYPEGYVDALQSQGGAVYETHILQILDSTGKEVELPQRTIVKVTDSDSNVIYNEQLSASSQVIFSLGDVQTTPVKSYTVEIDFSHVNYNDFYRAFTGTESTEYTVMDSMYLSTVEGVLGIGPTSAKLTFNVKKDSKIKLAVVPDKDSLSNLCINLNAKENDDETNSGIIDFSLNAIFDSSSVASADISFAVSKKVYNSTSGRYEYVALSEEEADIWTVYKDTTAITGDSLSVADSEASGNYRLVVNKESANLKLTNYCLTVTLTADDGTSANDYFVFLVCNIDVERNILPG